MNQPSWYRLPFSSSDFSQCTLQCDCFFPGSSFIGKLLMSVKMQQAYCGGPESKQSRPEQINPWKFVGAAIMYYRWQATGLVWLTGVIGRTVGNADQSFTSDNTALAFQLGQFPEVDSILIIYMNNVIIIVGRSRAWAYIDRLPCCWCRQVMQNCHAQFENKGGMLKIIWNRAETTTSFFFVSSISFWMLM